MMGGRGAFWLRAKSVGDLGSRGRGRGGFPAQGYQYLFVHLEEAVGDQATCFYESYDNTFLLTLKTK